MGIILFNTLSRKKERFAPLKKKTVTLYTCGPTVYRSQHIGNYRTFIAEDILRRILIINGFRVRHIMNITDVGHLVSDADAGEDKLAREARLTKKNAWDIARFYEREFKSDIKELRILPASTFVRATDHIREQIQLIRVLERKGFTYTTADGVYFDTSRIQKYGELAGRKASGTKAGARVEMREKRNPTDFALWKFSDPNSPKRQMEWRSPWGVGFPGWNIECSAMSMKYLGETIDIHCGGGDHLQIHHPNEKAQSEAATGKPFVRFWMHVAFLSVRGAKMAKSLPETNITLQTLKARGFGPLDFRYLMLGTHYRKPISFSWEALGGARNTRETLIASYQHLPAKSQKADKAFKEAILKAMNDDLNTPRALAVLWKGLHKKASRNFVLWADHIFGLDVIRTSRIKIIIPPLVAALAREREALRREKKWQEADHIRRKVEEMGYRIEDTSEGPLINKL